MKNALILHGTDDDSTRQWFPWLKSELEKLGYNVWCPDLPRANKPNIKRYTDFLLNNESFFNDKTLVIGHSSGAVEVLGLLQALPLKVHAVFCISAFKDSLGMEQLDELFLTPFDFRRMKNNTHKIVFVHSDNDPWCPLDGAKYLSEKTGGKLVVIPGQKHFSTSTMGEQYKQFPKLLEIILREI